MSDTENLVDNFEIAEKKSDQEPTEELPTETEVERFNKKNELENRKSNNYMVLNAAYYLFVFVVIGVPIWCLTTTTYRASLPFDEIDQINARDSLEISIKFNLVYLSPEKKLEKISTLKHELEELLNDEKPTIGLAFSYLINFRQADSFELSASEKSNKIEDLDKSLAKFDGEVLNIYVLDSRLMSKFKMNPEDYIFLNNLYLSETSLNDSKKVSQYIQNIYLNTKQFSENYDAKMNIKRKLPSKEDIKVVNFANEYEITFSLVNSKAKLINSEWNIENCIENYFQPVINQLAPFSNFSIKAQTLLFSDFDSYPASIESSENSEYYYLKQTDLAVMTNHIENRLGSRISDSLGLEFVTYVHSKQLPLFIKTNNDLKKTTSSFLIPRWGGIYIYNHENKESTTIDASKSMKVFLTQFISLIGIKLNKNPSNLERSQIYSSEIYHYLLTKTVENMLNSMNTLKSLSKLLTQIVSMVIKDEIADQIQTSVESLERSISYLNEGKIEMAFYESRTAFLSSEKAFFDESLLELLYFPEDQRFAIYIPLFIPVGIPLLFSLKPIIAFIKQNKKIKKE